MRFLEDADRYRLTLKEQEAYYKEVKKYSKVLEKENAAMHNLLVEFALKNDILPDIAFQMPALKGQKLQLKIGSKFTVVNEKAYDVIDAEEEGLVKRSIHWQTLQTFMKNCDESSRKILLSEEFIAEDETHSVKLL